MPVAGDKKFEVVDSLVFPIHTQGMKSGFPGRLRKNVGCVEEERSSGLCPKNLVVRVEMNPISMLKVTSSRPRLETNVPRECRCTKDLLTQSPRKVFRSAEERRRTNEDQESEK